MISLAHAVILAWGWKRFLMAFAAGAAGALALPPFGFLPALFLSLAPAIWLIDGTAGRWRLVSAAVAGWAWGFGYFVAGLWWLGAAFLVEAEQFAYAMPLGIIGLPAVLALFPAFGFGLARLFWRQGAGKIFIFAVALSISEYARGHLFTGFPWNTPGMALGQHLWLMQGASVVGLYGLTTLALLIGASPALLGLEDVSRPRRIAGFLLFLALLPALALFGIWRLAGESVANVPDIRLRIVQPNVPQDERFSAANREEIMRRYLEISDRATSPTSSGMTDVTHLIWPESAFPFLLHRDARALAQIAALLPPGSVLLTGAARAVDPLPGETGLRFHNSIHALADDGTIVSTYDKVHLVPFGEYLPKPFAAVIEAVGLRPFITIPGGFSPGLAGGSFTVPRLPSVAPAICYEAIFPGLPHLSGKRPGLILNVTNDAWFGNTPGPHQHLAQARLRAVELGVPLVRAANTGISAVIDPYGRILARLEVGQEGVLDSGLPSTIRTAIYARFGDISFLLLLLSLLLGSELSRKGRRT